MKLQLQLFLFSDITNNSLVDENHPSLRTPGAVFFSDSRVEGWIIDLSYRWRSCSRTSFSEWVKTHIQLKGITALVHRSLTQVQITHLVLCLSESSGVDKHQIALLGDAALILWAG